MSTPLCVVGRRVRDLELAEDVVSQVDRVGERLEREPVLRQAGDGGDARHGAERDHELPPGDVLHPLVRLDVRRASGEIDARHPPEQ
jgi:hypothetical protein